MSGSMTRLLAQFDEQAHGLLAAHKVPGIAIGVIDGGRVAAYRCHGVADTRTGAPIEPDTCFNVASISKSVTAWGVMRLCEAGQVHLDAPVGEYLKRWRLPPSTFDVRAVTVRRLLAHTAGINLSGCSASLLSTPKAGLLDILNGNMLPLDAAQVAYSNVWDVPLDSYNVPVRIEYEPGVGYHYSGGGYTMLELLIEDVSGRGFAEFMREQLLQPLNMRRATFDPTPHPHFAVGHDSNGAPLGAYRTNGLAAGGMFCSIEDLCTFALAGMPGGQGDSAGRGVVTPESLAQMHRPEVDAEYYGRLLLRYGLGHNVYTTRGATVVGHTGGNLGWRSVFWIVPALGKGVAMLLNGAGGNEVWQTLMRAWPAQVFASD